MIGKPVIHGKSVTAVKLSNHDTPMLDVIGVKTVKAELKQIVDTTGGTDSMPTAGKPGVFGQSVMIVHYCFPLCLLVPVA